MGKTDCLETLALYRKGGLQMIVNVAMLIEGKNHKFSVSREQ
ncbi:hypothetical protein [Bartonella rattaustraliani]|nr:hypothetical protein [Bartonella rattaustraliani]